MIRWILLFVLSPFCTLADPVAIRSGEHDTFSRLVLSIGEGTDWTVSPADGGYLLELSEAPEGFSTGEVFDRIPRTRITAFRESEPGSLFLETNCVCFADAFIWRPGQLVLDIVDGEQPDIPIPDDVADNESMVAFEEAPMRLPNLLALRNLPPPSPMEIAIPMARQTTPSSVQMRATEEALIAGLARAATQGIVEPQGAETEPASQMEQVVDSMRDLAGSYPSAGQPGIDISTAIDRDLASVRDAMDAALISTCLPADLFEISSWGDDGALHDQVAVLAESLAGEFGEEPREAQDTLARLYLYFGFGAEARVVLSADKALSQSRNVLVELAGLIDDYPGEYPLIASQADCDTPAALWAFYVAPTVLIDQDRNHILQEFFALPQPLRGQIAPRLSRKFISVGDPETAERILGASNNQDISASHDVQATRALIAVERDDPEEAIAVLSREASDNARTTPDSLIRLIELDLAQGRLPAEADLILASAMRQEFRGTPIADQLALAEAKGRLENGQYQLALNIVAPSQAAETHAVTDQIYDHMTQNAQTAVFLEFAYDLIPEGVTPETENAMARRLIDLGFPERALALLDGLAEREAAAQRRYLRAEAAIGMQDYSAVIDTLLGMNDSTARDLRARAYAGMGEYRSALEAADPMQPPNEGATMQFRAGAWERLAIVDDEDLSTFAQAILQPTVTGAADSLADRRAILAQSQESRRAVEGLLQRFSAESEEN